MSGFAALAAQARIVQLGQVQGAIQTPAGNSGEDDGPTVELFESPNLDRFLRRARQFLAEEKYQQAILVLQAVVEGRTLEATPVPGEGEPDADPAAPTANEPGRESGGKDAPADPRSNHPAAAPPGRAQATDGRKAGDKAGDKAGRDTPGRDKAGRSEDRPAIADPAQTVFSADGRIYRPARRLCHEYLSSLPAVGIELYQVLYEGLAQDLLAAALTSGAVTDLERVSNRYFPTLAAGRAMQVLADRLMHEGRYRSAVQVLRDLGELYPRANLGKLGISQLWCRFKIALCLRLAGEAGAALEAAQQLAADFPDESLRVMGDLQAVRDLPQSPLFALGDQTVVAAIGPEVDRGLGWLTPQTDTMVPLWQYRFAGPNPYAAVQSRRSSDSVVMFGEAVVANAAPPATKYGTGTQVAFLGRGFPAPKAVFLENFRLRIADAFTGVLERQGDGEPEPPQPQDGRPRARVPVYDLALQTPVEDDARYYAVLGYNKSSASVDPLKVNQIVAYAKDTLERVWTTAAFQEGEDGLADVTVLAAPTVFGERLLVPVLQRGAYGLQCLDRSTGQPLWRTRVHAGGTDFYKAPGARVVTSGSLAYMLTNAGAVAAIDAFAGDLRWIRRYERSDPLRQRPIGRRSDQTAMYGNMAVFFEHDLASGLPSDLIVEAGTIVLDGCDGQMLMCLDGASGEPVWMLDGTSHYAPYGRLSYIVGSSGGDLFAVADGSTDNWLVCIGLASGLVKWAQTVPGGTERLTRWRGRGCVLPGQVVLPGERELLVLSTSGRGEWRHVSLPPFGIGDEPLRGPNNVFCAGPWLGIAYAEGIEVYSTAAALQALAAAATEPMQRSAFLVQAGDLSGALTVLEQWLANPVDDQSARQRGETQAVQLARELALEQRGSGIAILDRVRSIVTARSARLAWHLARMDWCQKEQDLRAYEDEQQRLYRFMEGKD